MPEEIKKYVGPFSGPQMDQIFYEILNYTSERFAKGTANGVPVDPGTAGYEDNSLFYKNQAAAQAAQAQQAVTSANVQAARAETAAAAAEASENNARVAAVTAAAEADRAEDAAERAEAIVGGQFVSYGQPQGLNDTQKAQARANIGAEISEVKAATPGAIVTFNDGAAAPLEELEVELAIDQDLNGYAYPWPAGGGKNIFEPTSGSSVETYAGVTMALTGDTYTFTGTATNNGGRNTIKSATFNLPAGTYMLSAFGTHQINVYVVNESDNSNLAILASNGSPVTFTASADANVHIGFELNSGTTYDDAFTLQLETGSAGTSYAPYSNVCPITPHTAANITVNSNLYTVQLGGEYYAGELDVKTGRLTVKYGMVDMGALTWNYSSAYAYFYANVAGYKAQSDGIYTSIYRYGGVKSDAGMATVPNCTIYRANTAQVKVKNTAYTDKNTFKAAMSGVQLVYELATPLVIQLDPAIIYTAEGSNTVQADTGDILALSYRTKGSVQVEDFAALLAEETAGAGTSNRNLLHNSSFLVNPRGVSGTLSNGYGLDRWIVFASGGSVSYDATTKAVTLTATSNVAYLQQKAEDDLRAAIDGKTVTFSVLTTDGIVYKNTFTYDASAHDSGLYFPDNPKLRFWYGGDYALCLRVEAAYAITIKRIKLELGDKSTIANDVPDLAEERAKCEQYFKRIKSTTGNLFIAQSIAYSPTQLNIILPTTLRNAAISVVFNSLSLSDTAQSYPVTALTVVASGSGIVRLQATASGLTPGKAYFVQISADGYIDLSADL